MARPVSNTFTAGSKPACQIASSAMPSASQPSRAGQTPGLSSSGPTQSLKHVADMPGQLRIPGHRTLGKPLEQVGILLFKQAPEQRLARRIVLVEMQVKVIIQHHIDLLEAAAALPAITFLQIRVGHLSLGKVTVMLAIIYHLPHQWENRCSMQADWQRFLDDQGAVRDDAGVVRHFHGGGERILVGDHLSILRVRGTETEKFLQGQLTCDMKQVFAGHTRLAMHLGLKGRGMSSFRVLPAEDGVDLVTPRSRVDDTLAALKKYALFSKVTLEQDNERVALLFVGDAGAQLLHAYGIPVPGKPGEALFAPHTAVARLESGARYLLLMEHGRARKMLEQNTVNELGAADQWRRQDILAGEGHIEAGGEDLWLPQVLNYDVLDGVNFRKGCYLGQEIVARMHFKGQLKQRMQRRDWHGSEAPTTGTVLRNASGQAVGEVVTAVCHAGRVSALLVLRLDHSGDLLIDGHSLDATGAALPYALPATNQQ